MWGEWVAETVANGMESLCWEPGASDPAQPQQGFQHLGAAGCPLRNPVLVAVLLLFYWSWLGNVPKPSGRCPQAGPPWGGGGPGTQSCPWSSSGREPATGSSVITWGFMHGLNLNGKSREAPVYLLLLLLLFI